MININVSISRRKLKENEIDLLNRDIKSYPDLSYVGKNRWRKFQAPYILEESGKFGGVCAIYEFKDWIKVGPFVLLKTFHGKGYGKRIIKQIVNDYSKKDIFVVSSNPYLQSILRKNEFQESTNFFILPNKTKWFLIKQIIEYLSFKMLKEFIRKLFFLKRGSLHYFIKRFKSTR